VYKDSRENIVGVLLAKSLVMYNPEEARRLHDFSINKLPNAEASTPLFDILNTFQEGRSHMAVVVKADSTAPIGIITLEDVLEELIQEEIYDESDTHVRFDRGDQLFMASKKGRGSSVQVGGRRLRLKSRPYTRAESDPGTPVKSHDEHQFTTTANSNKENLILFDEPDVIAGGLTRSGASEPTTPMYGSGIKDINVSVDEV